MDGKKTNNALLAGWLVVAIFLWGGNNAAIKHMLGWWPPIWTGSSRFACAGLLLLALLHWTNLLPAAHRTLSKDIKRRLWWRGGLSLAVYIVVFNTAVRYTAVSHVALYLGASPIWALLWEGVPKMERRTFQRYGAAVLALSGVVVLFWPAIRASSHGSWVGEVLGLAASVLWTFYGRECRGFAGELTGAETTAQTMWRAGLLMSPLALLEVSQTGLVWRADLVWSQIYCIVAGGVIAFGIWNHALTVWPTSQVLLFNNLIPLSTMSWAWFALGEPVMPTFWPALALVAAGVALGQAKLPGLVTRSLSTPE
jgi:drug/metabolite transporter (DMT)-like permease